MYTPLKKIKNTTDILVETDPMLFLLGFIFFYGNKFAGEFQIICIKKYFIACIIYSKRC